MKVVVTWLLVSHLLVFEHLSEETLCALLSRLRVVRLISCRTWRASRHANIKILSSPVRPAWTRKNHMRTKMDLHWFKISAASFQPNSLGIALCLVFLANFLEAHGYGHFSLLLGGQTQPEVQANKDWCMLHADHLSMKIPTTNLKNQSSTTPLCLNPGNSAMKPARFQLLLFEY